MLIHSKGVKPFSPRNLAPIPTFEDQLSSLPYDTMQRALSNHSGEDTLERFFSDLVDGYLNFLYAILLYLHYIVRHQG
jgi:hypothetical protein